MLIISTGFPQDFESIIYDKDDATDYDIRLRPSDDFSKQKALTKLEAALARCPNIFQPDYDQRISLSKSWVMQGGDSSELDLNLFFNSFFTDGNDLGVSSIEVTSGTNNQG